MTDVSGQDPSVPDRPPPPRNLGLLMVAFGVIVLAGGVNIFILAGGPTFILIGCGVILSGLLVTLGKRAALLAYGVTFGVVLVGALLEEGSDVPALLTRLAVPTILGYFLVKGETRARLH